MSENRTDRTTNLGLLALMQSPAGGGPSSGVQGWGWPYWNQLWIDAVIAALHDAARDGVALLTAPATGPTVELSAETGYLPAGQTLEVTQTWVDEWGRETDAGKVTEFGTGEGIPNPDTAPTLDTPTPAATGFDGGPLEVAYCWIDEMAGESLPSPIAQIDVPYRTGGLQSEVLVTLPATPVSVGAAGAFIYARHRSGNWVRAAAISDDTETEVTLDGTWISCFVSLPLANSTGAGRALDITGIAAPAAAALTRFYIRTSGEAWTAGNRRLRVGGVDEWDPAVVTYPLVFRGGADEVAPGYPPPLTQIRPIRKIDLGTEVDGTIGAMQLPEEAVLEEELARSIGDALISGCEVAAHSPADMGVHVDAGEVLLAAGRFTPVACDRTIPAADATHPRIDLICIASDGAVEGPAENASLKGTPAATPAAPAVPAGYIKLAEVRVENGAVGIAAAKVTDKRTPAVPLMTHERDPALHFAGTEKENLLTASQKTELTGGNYTALHKHLGGLGGRAVVQAISQTAQLQVLIDALRASRVQAGRREIATMLYLVDQFPSLEARMADTLFLELFKDGGKAANGVIAGMVAETTADTRNMPISAGSCVFALEVDDYAGGTIEVPQSKTGYKIWWDGEVKGGDNWPAGAHTKLASVNSDASKITAVDNSVRLLQDGLDVGNSRFRVPAAGAGSAVQAGQSKNGSKMTATVAWMAPFRVSARTLVSSIAFPGVSSLEGAGRAYNLGILTADGSSVVAQTAAKSSGDKISDPVAFTGGPVWLEPGIDYLAGFAEAASAFGIANGYYDATATIEGSLLYSVRQYKTKATAGLTGSYSTTVADRYAAFRLYHTVTPKSGQWRSVKRTVPAGRHIGRLLPTWYAAHQAGVTEFTQAIEISFDDGLTWQSLVDGVELIPLIASPKSVTVRIAVTNFDPDGEYRLEDLGMVWELLED